MTLDWIGWQGLTPDAQFYAVVGGAGGLVLSLCWRVLFGGLSLDRRGKPARRIRHRPAPRPTTPKKRRRGKGRGKGRPKGRR